MHMRKKVTTEVQTLVFCSQTFEAAAQGFRKAYEDSIGELSDDDVRAILNQQHRILTIF